MIRIQKSAHIPDVLTKKGVASTLITCQLYEADSERYNEGSAVLPIDRNIYAADSVKQQLIDDQHGKCCFCEADFTANSFGDVEHFRPKGGYTTTFGSQKLQRPGYYWLAYEWDNLLFSCEVCNRRKKRNYFPVADETKRAKNHLSNLTNEKPLLINPTLSDPEKHISFNQHIPVPLDTEGVESIRGYGLDRDKLNRVRERYLRDVSRSVLLAKFDLDTMSEDFRAELVAQTKTPWEELEQAIRTARAFVKIAAITTEPFSAMVRANFSDLI